MRASSFSARAGMMARRSACDRARQAATLRTEMRKPSVAAMVISVAGNGDLHALQHRAGLIGRGGKGHLLDHFLEIGHLELHAFATDPAPAWAEIPGHRCL